jgi:hypothetical protein
MPFSYCFGYSSKKNKRKASSASLSPAVEEEDEIEEVLDETPVKSKGKKKAKR